MMLPTELDLAATITQSVSTEEELADLWPTLPIPIIDLSRKVIDVVARHYLLAPHSLLMRDKREIVAQARHVAMYLIRKLGSPRYSFPHIGRCFKRDHTTVIHGCQQVAKRAQEEAFARTLALLEKIVLENG